MKTSPKALCMTLVMASLALSTPAWADLRVTFTEGAPKDRFTLLNTGACALEDATVVLDLSPSKGGLIFDVTAQGAGVQVFQPFEVVSGQEALTNAPQVQDGQSALTLDIRSLAPNAAIAFTIDVDDTIGQREITVTGSEIEGASVSYIQGGQTVTAPFTGRAVAEVVLSGCLS